MPVDVSAAGISCAQVGKPDEVLTHSVPANTRKRTHHQNKIHQLLQLPVVTVTTSVGVAFGYLVGSLVESSLSGLQTNRPCFSDSRYLCNPPNATIVKTIESTISFTSPICILVLHWALVLVVASISHEHVLGHAWGRGCTGLARRMQGEEVL